MNISEILARTDSLLRKQILRMNPWFSAFIYSYGRKAFLKLLESSESSSLYHAPEHFQKKLWGIHFSFPLFNAAGMFKTGNGYEPIAMQGAGAYLAGTTTSEPRAGNIRNLILHPFVPYPRSGSASNWMGLPNPGHDTVAKNLYHIERVKGCPVGASAASSPAGREIDSLNGILEGLKLYERANVDFIEVNESCPNVTHGSDINAIDENLINRLEYISKKFIERRRRFIPIIVKFSNDLAPSLLPGLLDILINLKFDGINLGNTTTNYQKYSDSIHPIERKNFEYFYSAFGGGLSGRLLKDNSLQLASDAVELLRKKNITNEFHVIRTGGIESLDDIIKSEAAGISLNQWFTGYFDAYSKYGSRVYRNMFSS